MDKQNRQPEEKTKMQKLKPEKANNNLHLKNMRHFYHFKRYYLRDFRSKEFKKFDFYFDFMNFWK